MEDIRARLRSQQESLLQYGIQADPSGGNKEPGAKRSQPPRDAFDKARWEYWLDFCSGKPELRPALFNTWEEGFYTHYVSVGTVQLLVDLRAYLVGRNLSRRRFHLRWKAELQLYSRCLRRHFQFMKEGLYTHYAFGGDISTLGYAPRLVYFVEKL